MNSLIKPKKPKPYNSGSELVDADIGDDVGGSVIFPKTGPTLVREFPRLSLDVIDVFALASKFVTCERFAI